MESSGESPSVEPLVDLPEPGNSQIPKRRSGMKLSRIPSSKYRKASTKKLMAAADQKTKLRKSRSIKLSRSTTTRPGIKKYEAPVVPKKPFDAQDSSVNTPTCSSSIKGSKFSDEHADVHEPGCDLPKKASSAKACPYSYCSLHGHGHAAAAAAAASPSLKRVKSSRKRVAARSKKSGTCLPLDEELNKEIDTCFTGKNDESDENERKDDHSKPPREVEIPDSRSGVAFRSTIGGRKYTVLWMLIYEKMVSDIASERPVQGNIAQDTEFVASNDNESDSGTNASTPDEQMGICQGDLVKLLQELLDKLLLSQKLNQSPDNQSVGDDSNLSGASSHTELKYEAESGVNTPRELRHDEASSNRWSRLRKLILMKRFVKALEKTKRFDPRTLHCQKSEVCHEAEEVNLRRQSIGERKRSEEWMLDYALREVVSKLDMDRQRRVSLLVEAFEKFSLMQGGNPSSGLGSSSGSRFDCSLESGEESTRDASRASLDGDVELFESEQKNKEARTDRASLDRDVVVLETEQKNKEARTDDLKSCVLASENYSEWSTEEPTASDSASASDPEAANSVEAVDEGLIGQDNNPAVPFDVELGRGKNNGLWSLIYANMVSDIENSEGRLPVRGVAAGKTEDGERGGDLNDAIFFKGESESDRDTTALTPDGQADICQSDAVKLLQEALGKLLQQQEVDQSFGSSSDADNGTVSGRTENSNNGSDTRSSDKPVLSNRWSRLKKLILLKRFVRAVEKAKKLDPKLRRHHPTSEAYADAETVSLRRQSIEERKRSEEWMLDYTLRQAVSKLDQDQKRRVSLLVEAFEKMSPAQGCIPAVHPNSATSSYFDQTRPTLNQKIAHMGSGFEGETLLGCAVDGERSTLVSKNEGHGTNSCPDSTEKSQAIVESPEPHSENKRYTQLWYLVYRHMVSGLDAEEGQGNASSDGTDTSRHRQILPDQNADDMDREKIEAVKLVQEAIDGIPLLEGEDSSINNHSPDFPGNEIENAENLQEIDNVAVEEREGTESKSDDKFGDRGGAVKNWNNLKKVVLIKRFVKSLEKVGKLDFQRQKPQHKLLPEGRGHKEERVSLRRQDTDERKNAEEWMLDYAVRRVVSELTPARKRKVKLLVEAFESVAPPVV